MDFETFFDRWGSVKVTERGSGDFAEILSIEELYQAFKERIKQELAAENEHEQR